MGPGHRVALLLLCTLPGVTAASDGDPLSPEERAWVEQNGPIRYATEPDYPPFEFDHGDGVVDGINMDLLNRMSRNLGVEFQVVRYGNWSQVLAAMQAGEVQLVGTVAPTPERETYMDFVGPYMDLGQVFYVNTDRDDLRSEADLAGRRVAVVRNYAAGEWLASNHPEVRQVLVDDVLDGLEAVSAGGVDAFFDSIPVAGYHIRQHSLSNVRILGDPLYYSPAHWAVPDGESVLAGIVRKGLASIPPGEQTAVFEYWTGYDLGVERQAAVVEPGPVFSPVALAVTGGLLATVAAAGAWTRTLRRAVHRRTQDLWESRDQVRRANEELEARVRERSRELGLLLEREGRLYEGMEAAADRMTVRVDRVADELRNRYHGLLRPDTRMLLDAAQSAAWDLAGLVAAAAETTRIEPDGQGREVALGPLLRREAERVARRHPRTPVLACEQDLSVSGDPRAMGRLATHLTSFAVALEASAVQASSVPEGVRVVLTGCGVRVGDPAALLEPLRVPGVAGMALPAVARVVHRNGGDVDLRREGDDLVLTLRFRSG